MIFLNVISIFHESIERKHQNHAHRDEKIKLQQCQTTKTSLPAINLSYSKLRNNFQFHIVLFPGTVEPVGAKNNGDGTHTVHYTPAQDGPYTVAVKYADQEVPHRYSGSPGSVCRYILIKVPLCLAGFRKKKCSSANFLFPFLSFVGRGLVITLDILSSLHSPFKVMSQPGHDASKVRASGPGLDTKGVPASLPVEFTIDARDAGEGLLTVQILVGSASFHKIVFFLP